MAPQGRNWPFHLRNPVNANLNNAVNAPSAVNGSWMKLVWNSCWRPQLASGARNDALFNPVITNLDSANTTLVHPEIEFGIL